ncbi:MAG: hypothetical protein JNM14_02380 [Ferruginibacter sp.]|nr:hypothetical protein [Ferruginibacter sp.]
MIVQNNYLTKEQKANAVQRLTALWAFTESGLGGIMHALQIPFTGLLVGGMAVIMISLIAGISEKNYKHVLKSAMIVLIVKAMVSPHTPVPAYIAVAFQALLGYGLFSLIKVNFLSIVLLSTISMVESAIQKLLILTLFFGKSLWKAMDEMITLLTKQFGSVVANGSYWIIGIYLLIYVAGGFFIAWLAYRTIKNFSAEKNVFTLQAASGINNHTSTEKIPFKKRYQKLWLLIGALITLSVMLFVFAADKKQGLLAVVKTISWTLSAILIWYMLIGPLFTKAIQKFLHKKQSRYSDEVLKTLSFLPVLRNLTTLAWQKSRLYSGFRRWYFFFTALIHATLIYSEPVISENNL